jgi:hypothetical protein
MPALDLHDLMRLYARQGIADWRNAPDELRRRARDCLGSGKIADNETEAFVTLNTIYSGTNADRLRFIPMPKRPRGGIERCFFLPIWELDADQKQKMAYDLFLLIARRDCLAFRFEQAHLPQTTHGYGHVQMSRLMLRKTIIPNILQWIPDSYPAFPLLTSDPLRMFLSMATAVHGYAGGILSILQEIFQQASRSREASLYVNELKAMFN